jgi:hypothetical protein
MSAAVAGTTFRPPRSYTTLWDVTVTCDMPDLLWWVSVRWPASAVAPFKAPTDG